RSIGQMVRSLVLIHECLTLSHLDRYEKWLDEAGIETDRKAPILLPEYRGKKTLEHQIKLL
nr:hypothetical protein [Candidatus Bathyarchaeota archaeon]